MTEFKLSAVAFAAMALSCGAANAQAYVASSGASALRGTTITIVQAACSGGAANTTVFQAATADGGSNVRAVRCNPTAKVFSLDTDGGSWRAYAVHATGTAGNPTLAQFQAAISATATANGDPSLKPVRYLDLAACLPTTGGAGTAASPFVCAANAAKTVVTGGSPDGVSIGFTDTNPAFFDGLTGVNLGVDVNRPNSFTGVFPRSDAPGSATFPALGVVFGVAASRTLYEAMMNDQGITAANSPSCWVGALADLANESCAPVISKDQYRSITTATGNALNKNYNNLFLGAPLAGTVTVERRDFGSGTQSAANAYFQGVGCTPYFLTPATAGDSGVVAGYVVKENNASADVITALSTAGAKSVGVLSRESAPTTGGGWGFLKLGGDKGAVYTALASNSAANQATTQGAYPHQNNAVRGLYDFWTVAWVHNVSTGGKPDVAALVSGLTSGASFTPGAGTIKLTELSTAAGTNGLGTATVTTGTYYGKGDMGGACGGALAAPAL